MNEIDDFVSDAMARLMQSAHVRGFATPTKLGIVKTHVRWVKETQLVALKDPVFLLAMPVINRSLESRFNLQTSLDVVRRVLVEFSRAVVTPAAKVKHASLLRKFYVPASPYSPEQIHQVLHWATAQPSPRRDDAQLLLGLALGAGLRACELPDVRGRDVFRGESGDVFVRCTGEHARVVPVLDQWSDTLILRAEHLDPDDRFFDGSHRAGVGLVYNFINRSSNAGLRPNTRRTRASWICEEVTRNVPTKLVLERAGLKSWASLDRIRDFLPD